MNWNEKKDELTRLIIEENKSYEEIGRMFGVTGRAIKNIALRLEIPLTPRRAIKQKETFNRKSVKKGVCLNCGKEFVIYKSHTGKFCCHECMGQYQRNKMIEDWKAGKVSGTCAFTFSSWVKRYMLEKVGYKCERCGFSGENPYTHLTILQIHHKDGNSLNNREENLEVLCPNCHALTENFGSRNKNAHNGKSKYYRNI